MAAILTSGTAILGQDEISRSSTSSSSIPTSQLVGRKIKASQGEEIGIIKDVVLARSNGCVAYTVISAGDAQTRNVKMIVVPWAAYSPASDASTLRVNVDREKIYNAPVFDYARIDEYARPDYINNVYSYYGVVPSSRTAIAAGTDATGTAGATVSPGEVASPGPASTVASNKTPSARTHAASAAKSHGASTHRQSATPQPGERED